MVFLLCMYENYSGGYYYGSVWGSDAEEIVAIYPYCFPIQY